MRKSVRNYEELHSLTDFIVLKTEVSLRKPKFPWKFLRLMSLKNQVNCIAEIWYLCRQKDCRRETHDMFMADNEDNILDVGPVPGHVVVNKLWTGQQEKAVN